MNRVILVGNLTRDIEVRYGQTGLAIGKTGIATNRKTKTSSGEMREEVMFIDITFFGRTAEMAQQYFRKGSKILVEGRLSLDQWVDQSGMKRSKHSVIVENLEFVESKANSQNNNYNSGGNNQPNYGGQQQPQYGGGYNNSSNNQNGGYNSYQSNDNNYGNRQGASQQPPVEQPSNTGKSSPKNDDIPEIDIDDMDDQVPF